MGAKQSSSSATDDIDLLLQQSTQRLNEQQHQLQQQIQQKTLQMEQEHQLFQQQMALQMALQQQRLQTVSVFDYEFDARAALAEIKPPKPEQPILNAIVETILRNVENSAQIPHYLTEELLVTDMHKVDGIPCKMEAAALADRGHLVTIITLKVLFRVNADLLARVQVAEAAGAAAIVTTPVAAADSQPGEV